MKANDVVLTIGFITSLTEMVTETPQGRPSNKDKAIERLHARMTECLGPEETLKDWDKIILAEEPELAFVVLKRKLIEFHEKQGRVVTRLKHTFINGLTAARVKEIETALKEGKQVMTIDPNAQVENKAKAKGKAKAKPKEKKEGTGRRGRTSEMYGKKIKSKVQENPRREGTNGWHSMKIVLDNPNIKVEDFVEKGGRLVDLKWDVDKGNVELLAA